MQLTDADRKRLGRVLRHLPFIFYIIITHYAIKRLDSIQNAWYAYSIKLKKGATRVAEVKENGRRKNSTS